MFEINKSDVFRKSFKLSAVIQVKINKLIQRKTSKQKLQL